MTANGYAYDIKQAEGLGQELVDAQKIHYLLGSKARSVRDPLHNAYMHTSHLSLSPSPSFPLPLPILPRLLPLLLQLSKRVPVLSLGGCQGRHREEDSPLQEPP